MVVGLEVGQSLVGWMALIRRDISVELARERAIDRREWRMIVIG